MVWLLEFFRGPIILLSQRTNDKLQLRELLVGDCPATKNLFSDGLVRNNECVRQHALSHLTSTQGLQAARYFLCVLPAVERRNANVSFALCAETGAGCDDDIQLRQHPIEHLPAR